MGGGGGSEGGGVLGKADDVAKYSALLKNVKDAYIKEYMTSNGRLVSSTQTAYVLALNFDMLPESLRAQAAAKLAENIKAYNNHLTTGFLGTPYLCHVLSRFGYLILPIPYYYRKPIPPGYILLRWGLPQFGKDGMGLNLIVLSRLRV